MCTLAIAFYPQTKLPLIIGANRDENPMRQAKPWAFRNGVFSPLDVRGGTWVGVNMQGIFCAITNWDLPQIKKHGGFKSRGDIVLSSLNYTEIDQIINYWNSINPESFRPFNIIAGTKESLFHLSCDSNKIQIQKLGAGFHWSTGEGFVYNTKRSNHIYNTLRNKLYGDLSQPVLPNDMQLVLLDHNDGIGSENSVCVHDNQHQWETRSSSLIVVGQNHCQVKYIDEQPCQADLSKWQIETFNLQNS